MQETQLQQKEILAVLLLILGIYILQRLRKIIWSLCTKK